MASSLASSPNGAPADNADDWRKIFPALAVIAAFGLVLRISAANGDLWLDEIWSLTLLAKITSVDQVFWRINHDNNHFLNSIWMYLMGPDASFFAYRALSIVIGTATIFAAAAVVADRGRAAQYVAAILFAVSYPIVNFGSEARGYSGLILFSLLSIWALQRRLDGKSSGIPLAVVILLGFLSHLTMIAIVFALVVWTIWTLLLRDERPLGVLIEVIRIFLPAFIAVLPLVAVIVYGDMTYGFTVGGLTPFSLDFFFRGAASMAAFTLGLPQSNPRWISIAAVIVPVALAAWVAPSKRSSLYLIGVVAIPLAMMSMKLPNLQSARYFLPCIIMYLLGMAELIGHLIGTGRATWQRIFATVLLVLLLLSSCLALWRFFELSRGYYSAAVAEITADPDQASYAASNAFRTEMVVDYLGRRAGSSAELVQTDDLCERQPEWYVQEVRILAVPEETIQLGDCKLFYDGVMFTETQGLSGISWALYRRRY